MLPQGAPPSVKLFIALLLSPDLPLDQVLGMLEEVFGSADFIGTPHPFDVTDSYEAEMGPGLVRTLVGFTGPHHADMLVPGKRACIALERGLAVDDQRTANLDLGYLDENKIVLASTKGAGQKIYLSDGIYVDLIARYGQGSYKPFEWSFQEFTDGWYNTEFQALRHSLLEGSRKKSS
jgi:hypothetical protein